MLRAFFLMGLMGHYRLLRFFGGVQLSTLLPRPANDGSNRTADVSMF
jgi:hypothetical protein